MRFVFAYLLLALWAQHSCLAQSALEVETLIRQSKLVETSRPLRVVVHPKQIIVSTYIDRKASDRDCKITALLMTKEIVGKYPKIDSVHVNFFDQLTASSYRRVLTEKKYVTMLDHGSSINSVLSGLSILHGTANFQTGATKVGSKTATVRKTSTTSGANIDGYVRHECKQGNFAISCPSNWRLDPNLEASQVFRCKGEGGLLMVSFDHKDVSDLVAEDKKWYPEGYKAYAKLAEDKIPLPNKDGVLLSGLVTESETIRWYAHNAYFREDAGVYSVRLYAGESGGFDESRNRLLKILSTFQAY